jgi:uncharacterized alkaline shock family protein YloU
MTLARSRSAGPSKEAVMSETQSPGTPARPGAAGEPAEASSRSMSRRGNEKLSSEGGSTTIADAVVTKIASIAAREVGGVHDLGGGTARTIGGITRSVGVGPDERMQGVGVEVGEREAAVDLTVVVEYGESIPRIADALRENITRRIEGMTGLTVTEVNIAVNDLYFPGDEAAAEPARVE